MNLEEFNSALERNPAKTYIVACSGGIDSMALFHLMVQSGKPFAVAHVNYNLRGADSTADAKLVEEQCSMHNIACYTSSIDLNQMLKQKKTNLQHKARTLRYDFFNELASRFEDALIVVAHHREDQVETFFLHLLRNSGLAGLSGMQERQDRIVRPLLQYSKADIEAYAAAHGISWRQDKSNLETKYLRNALRLEVIPLLRQENAQLATDVLLLQNVLNHFYQEVVSQAKDLVEQWQSNSKIPISDLKIDAAVLVEAFKEIKIEPRFIPSILRLINAENGKQVALKNHPLFFSSLVKQEQYIHIIGDSPAIHFTMKIEKVSSLPDSYNTSEFYISGAYPTASLYLSVPTRPIRFIPLGLKTPKSVNAILKSHGIPLFQRNVWPVLFLANEPVGVPGICLNKNFKPKETENSYIKVTFTSC